MEKQEDKVCSRFISEQHKSPRLNYVRKLVKLTLISKTERLEWKKVNKAHIFN